MQVTPALRQKLKKPLGTVVADVTVISPHNAVISVGDTASDNLIKAGYKPAMVVYDAMTKRKSVGVSEAIRSYDADEYRVKNPAGSLMPEVFAVFRKILGSGRPGKVFVEGEEDLTTLAAIKEAENGWVVVYGQPDEGMVVVEVDDKIKKKVGEILREMEDGR